MNTTIWIMQSLMALLFLYSGINKSIFSAQILVAKGQTGVEGLPIPLIRFIGVSEILGAFGLILPSALKILPFLTPFSALSMAAIMVPAALIHYKRHEPGQFYKTVSYLSFVYLSFLAGRKLDK